MSNRYELYSKIGSGGAATVHLAKIVGDNDFFRVVAIKRLKPAIARDEEARAALIAEACLAARVSHPNVVPLFDVIEEPNEVFLVMDYVHGEPFNRLLGASKRAGGPPPLGISLAVVTAALRGLHAAHEARGEDGKPLELVHRDVSPQNLVVGADGVTRLLDFGIAKATTSTHRTRTGEVKGKLGYMPPEQLCGEPLDRRTDVFAAGIILWEAIVGSRLFRGSNDEESIALALSAKVTAPSVARGAGGDRIPEALDAVVLKALARRPEDRFATALDMATAIEACKIPLAAATEIGDWVEGLAKDALEERAAQVRAMSSAVPELVLHPTESALSRESTQVIVLDSRPSLEAGTEPTRGKRPANSMRAIAGAAIGGVVLVAGVALAFGLRAPHANTTPENKSTNASGSASVATETDDVGDADAGASVIPATKHAGATPNPARGPSRRPTSPRHNTSTSAKCNPPYTIDEANRKHFKPECF